MIWRILKIFECVLLRHKKTHLRNVKIFEQGSILSRMIKMFVSEYLDIF